MDWGLLWPWISFIELNVLRLKGVMFSMRILELMRLLIKMNWNNFLY